MSTKIKFRELSPVLSASNTQAKKIYSDIKTELDLIYSRSSLIVKCFSHSNFNLQKKTFFLVLLLVVRLSCVRKMYAHR